MQNRIVIFDLDGTIYQNSVFHRGYLRTLVAGTWAEPLEADLVRLAEAIFAGRELDMNRFYRRGRAEAATVPELVQALRKRVLWSISATRGPFWPTLAMRSAVWTATVPMRSIA